METRRRKSRWKLLSGFLAVLGATPLAAQTTGLAHSPPPSPSVAYYAQAGPGSGSQLRPVLPPVTVLPPQAMTVPAGPLLPQSGNPKYATLPQFGGVSQTTPDPAISPAGGRRVMAAPVGTLPTAPGSNTVRMEMSPRTTGPSPAWLWYGYGAPNQVALAATSSAPAVTTLPTIPAPINAISPPQPLPVQGGDGSAYVPPVIPAPPVVQPAPARIPPPADVKPATSAEPAATLLEPVSATTNLPKAVGVNVPFVPLEQPKPQLLPPNVAPSSELPRPVLPAAPDNMPLRSPLSRGPSANVDSALEWRTARGVAASSELAVAPARLVFRASSSPIPDSVPAAGTAKRQPIASNDKSVNVTFTARKHPALPAVERACTGLARAVEMAATGQDQLTIRAAIRRPADAEFLTRSIAQLPEFAPYRVFFEFRVEP